MTTIPGEEARALLVRCERMLDGIGQHGKLLDDIRAHLAHQSPSRAAGEGIPAGMKPWAGGVRAPEDWDGGPCLLRGGEYHTPDAIDPGNDWSHDPQWGSAEDDIVAYTPKATPQTAPANAELPAREALGGLIKWADNVMRAHGITAEQKAVTAAKAALATPAELPALPSREEIARGVEQIAGQFKRIAALHPNEQPCYSNGVRPFGTGDLRYIIEVLDNAFTALHPPASVAEVERLREALGRAIVFSAYRASDPLAIRFEFATDEDRVHAADAVDQFFLLGVHGIRTALSTPMPDGEGE